VPKFSIIIPTLNEEGFIGQCLKSLRTQETDESYEIIVADSHSTDRTVKIAEKFADKIVLCNKGISVGRNAGARASSGDYLIFIDADSIASPSLVQAYSEAFARKDCIAATGPIFPRERMNAVEDHLIRIGSGLYTKSWIKFLIRMGKPAFIGSNSAFRKDGFFEVGGFREHLKTFEDGDLSMRLVGKGRFVFHDDALVYTSLRRLRKWGYMRFVGFHLSNTFRYMLTKSAHEDYEAVR